MASKFKPLNLKVDLKQLLGSAQVENLSKHLTSYEKRVKELVKELDLKSRDAREKSKEQLAKFTSQVRKTSTDVEKNVKDLLQQEGKALNQKLTDLVAYLKGLATNEKKAGGTQAPQATAAPTKARGKSAGTKKAGAPRKRAPKKAATESAPASQA